MAIKLAEHTDGTHIYMRLRLDNKRIEEIDAYITETGWTYRTSADKSPDFPKPEMAFSCILALALAAVSLSWVCVYPPKGLTGCCNRLMGPNRLV